MIRARLDGRDPARRAHVARIKQWLSARLQLDDAATLVVAELDCAAPGCPPRETSMVVVCRGERAQRTIHRALLDVDEAAVRAAWSTPPSPPGGHDD